MLNLILRRPLCRIQRSPGLSRKRIWAISRRSRRSPVSLMSVNLVHITTGVIRCSSGSLI